MDRAAEHRTDPQWLEQAWQRARVLVVDSRGRANCLPDPALVWLEPDQAPAVPASLRCFLGVDEAGTPYFAVAAPLPEHPGATPVSVRQVGADLGDRDAGLFTTAVALMNWHATHPYAPATGSPTTPAQAGWVRLDAGGKHLFPRTDPAIIVLVHDGVAGPAGRCLLGNNAAWPVRDGRRFFSTLAGFVEPGESAEAAVEREVREEVGVRVGRLRYRGSQAWPYPGSLMLGFTGHADPSQPVRPDLTEIAQARWFTRTEIAALLSTRVDPEGAPYGEVPAGATVALPGPASIAQFLIRTWLDDPDPDRG